MNWNSDIFIQESVFENVCEMCLLPSTEKRLFSSPSRPQRLRKLQQELTILNTVKLLIQGATNPKTSMFLVPSCSCRCPFHWSHVLSRCSNYFWVISSVIAYEGATYIRGLAVCVDEPGSEISLVLIWGFVRQKQVSRAGTSNYIPQYLCGVIICPCPWASGTRVLIWTRSQWTHFSSWHSIFIFTH